jgi:hypothetical protein
MLLPDCSGILQEPRQAAPTVPRCPSDPQATLLSRRRRLNAEKSPASPTKGRRHCAVVVMSTRRESWWRGARHGRGGARAPLAATVNLSVLTHSLPVALQLRTSQGGDSPCGRKGQSPAGGRDSPLRGQSLQQRHQQQRHDVDDLDQRVDGRARGVLVQLLQQVCCRQRGQAWKPSAGRRRETGS